MAIRPIDPDVLRIARRFGVDPKLIQAVVIAEGDILKAVRCSLPNTLNRDEAIEVTCRSAAHAMSDFIRSTNASEFIEFWGSRWAPVGAANDPENLNHNWPSNVRRLWVQA